LNVFICICFASAAHTIKPLLQLDEGAGLIGVAARVFFWVCQMIQQRILFVCTGNICRSPTAEGVARALAEKQGMGHLFTFDSAGTIGYHKGEPPDRRAIAAAARRGYDLAPLRARQVTESDFFNFDHVLAMDRGHLKVLEKLCPPMHRQGLGLFLEYAGTALDDEVPDPYYGGPEGFEHVLTLVENAADQLIRRLSGETPRS